MLQRQNIVATFWSGQNVASMICTGQNTATIICPGQNVAVTFCLSQYVDFCRDRISSQDFRGHRYKNFKRLQVEVDRTSWHARFIGIVNDHLTFRFLLRSRANHRSVRGSAANSETQHPSAVTIGVDCAVSTPLQLGGLQLQLQLPGIFKGICQHWFMKWL